MALATVYQDDGFLDARRAAVVALANPRNRLDYTVRLSRTLELTGGLGRVTVSIRYVPDALVMDATCLANYCTVLADQEWDSLEMLAACILDDLNNELVPRWVRVRLTSTLDQGTTQAELVMEDRQPNWTGRITD